MLKFHTITMKNFMSVGDNPITVQLDRSPTTAITGENGSGKSLCVTDAIAYALFGKSYRGVNKPNLVNTINKKDCQVEIEFSQGSTKYRVVRGMKPGKFEIYKNGKMLEQECSSRDQQKFLEDNILHFSYKPFCQTCILGTANYTPFMQLTTGARREVNDSLLDVGVFGTMYKILKARHNDWKDRLRNKSAEIDKAKQAYRMQSEFVDTLKNQDDEQIQRKKSALSKLRERTAEASVRKEENEKELSEIQDSALASRFEEAKKRASERERMLTKLTTKAEHHAERREFFDEYNECPTCFQYIDGSHREKILAEVTDSENSTQKEIEEIQESITHYKAEAEGLKETIARVRELEQNRKNEDRLIRENAERAQELISEIEELNNAETRSHAESEQKLESLGEDVKRLDKEYRDLLSEQEVYEVGLKLLKDDGIKSSIIRQYLPVLNSTVNHYLQLLNFPVKFELDEDFNETLRSRYRDEFSYENFSQGERQRLDTAILMAWRYVASLKNSVNTNLLVLDEVLDASLDSQGTDDLLTIINDLCKSGNTNVFIVSHKSNLEEKLQSHIHFGKVNGFTRMQT